MSLPAGVRILEIGDAEDAGANSSRQLCTTVTGVLYCVYIVLVLLFKAACTVHGFGGCLSLGGAVALLIADKASPCPR
jgi:hypothetical protein